MQVASGITWNSCICEQLKIHTWDFVIILVFYKVYYVYKEIFIISIVFIVSLFISIISKQ